MSRYACVDDQKAAGFPVTTACEVGGGVDVGVLRLVRSVRRPAPTERQVAEAELVELMREIFDAADGNYGVPRMHRELRHAGLVVNEQEGAAADAPARHGRPLHPPPGAAPRSPARTATRSPISSAARSHPAHPMSRGAKTSPTSPTGEGWLYLASVLDLGTRRLLGYSMADHMRTELVLDALAMAVAARGGNVAGVIAHADRGSQYTSNDYLDFCQTPPAPTLGRPDRRCAGTTPWPSRSGHHSSANASKAASSPPAPKPAGRSSAGSTGTTRRGCTPASTTSHPSSGNSSTVKRHNHPSAQRGDAHVDPHCVGVPLTRRARRPRDARPRRPLPTPTRPHSHLNPPTDEAEEPKTMGLISIGVPSSESPPSSSGFANGRAVPAVWTVI